MADRSAQISRVTSSAPVAEPLAVEDRPQNYANSSTNSMSNAASSSPIESVTKSGVEVGSAGTSSAGSSSVNANAAAAPPLVAQEKVPADARTGDTAIGGKANEPSAPEKLPLVAAPQTAAKEKDAEDRREVDEKKSLAKTEQDKISRNDDLNKMDAQAQNNVSRDMSPGSNSAKMKAAGPRQVQSQTQNQAGVSLDGLPVNGRAVSSLRTAGGKKFEFRNGIWYDTAYTGQGKKDVKRGTDKFLRLDAGLRSIADQIGGTVVVVWNGQAYKIK
jgi:hypothetical protein